MNIKRMSLIVEESARDLAQSFGKEAASSGIDISCSLQGSKGKPWPLEFSLHMEIHATEKQVGDGSSMFSSDLRYAVAFDDPNVGEEITAEIIMLLWPHVRAELADQMRRYDMSAAILPLSFDLKATA